jgi:uncharacterized Fe-S cluster protein YjdI
MERKHYQNEQITVVWQPKMCIHSGKCFRGLHSVFDPLKRPWITLEGADNEAVVAQVEKCPSGALSYFRNESRMEETDTPVESTLETRIEVQPNGPLLIYGTLKVKDVKGNEKLLSNTTAFCRCGQSKTKPFCDGSHIEARFKDE